MGSLIERLKARLRPAARPVDRWHLETDEDCIAHLARLLPRQAREGTARSVLVVGDDGPARARLRAALEAAGLRAIACTADGLDDHAADAPDCITTTHFESRAVTALARRLVSHPALRAVPFEYILSKANYASYEQYDPPAYSGFYFINPLLQDDIDYLAIYRESLASFDLKCDIRDYLDICQVVREVLRNGIPGDVVEFGSYKGHSGYLLARLLEAHGSDKKVHMFDTFESFPGEALGIDRFWSDTHPVIYEEVAAKLARCPNARLVKGEFEATVPASLPPRVCLAYVDCDSYRATRYLLDRVYDGALARGGVVAFEDYGHPALLGNRLAVDEFFAGRNDCLRLFSQFSGIYLVRKP